MHLAILPDWRGKWFSDRVGRQIVAYGLQKARQLVAIIREDDQAVQRMAKAYGFVLTAPGRWQECRWPDELV